MSERVDIGHEHFMMFFSWNPDRTIERNAVRFKDIPDDPKAGVIVEHPQKERRGHPLGYPEGVLCQSAIHFDTETNRKLEALTRADRPIPFGHRSVPAFPLWQVVSWDPLTVTPSLLCELCGDHGFIREGRWVPA